MLFVIGDCSAARFDSIARVVRGCGATVQRASDDAIDGSGHAACALIASVAAEPERQQRDVVTIRRAANRGLVVVAIVDADALRPLPTRCRVLLAGARQIVDADAIDFEGDLRRVLTTFVDTEGARGADDRRLRNLFEPLGLVGRSAAMLAVFRRIEKISRFSELPALIFGESGTGKELVARAIHRLDAVRRDHPFVAVNCAAINGALAESEFFGHRKGAYTGADRDRKGLFRAADGGVLFLDEIGDLSLELQAKLLRVLQERRVLVVGEDRDAPVDLRVVAATHRDLKRMVESGQFREDLYHRLKLLTVQLPPLRARPADLPVLVRHFMARNRADPRHAGVDFLEALGGLELRGNARELENLVRSALVEAGPDSPLRLSDLPPETWDELGGGAAAEWTPDRVVDPGDLRALQMSSVTARPPDDGDAGNLDLARSLARCEKSVVEAAMRKAFNNRSKAARFLGITPRSVYNKLRRHGIEP